MLKRLMCTIVLSTLSIGHLFGAQDFFLKNPVLDTKDELKCIVIPYIKSFLTLPIPGSGVILRWIKKESALQIDVNFAYNMEVEYLLNELSVSYVHYFYGSGYNVGAGISALSVGLIGLSSDLVFPVFFGFEDHGLYWNLEMLCRLVWLEKPTVIGYPVAKLGFSF